MRNRILERLTKSVEFLKKNNLYPYIPEIEVAHRPHVTVKGKGYLLFASNSYLGLNIHPRVANSAKAAIDHFGTGAGNSRLLSGTLAIHRELERTIAWFKHTEDAIVFPSGFSTNIGVIPALATVVSLDPNKPADQKVIIFSDELNHASIIEGCRLSKVKAIKYKHCNVEDLDKKLSFYRDKDVDKIVITDGIFSLDGDVAPLDKIVPAGKRHNCLIMVDDAHGTGTLGKKGRGIVEHFGVQDEIDVMMGTFSKVLASAGGFIAGSKILIDYLRIAARSYVFTAGIPPSVAATVIEALHVIDEEPELIVKVKNNAQKIRDGFRNLGFNILNTVTPVIPMLIGDERKTIQMSYKIFKQGIIAPPVRYPAVPKGQARIRFTASSLHTDEQIDQLLDVVAKTGKELAII